MRTGSADKPFVAPQPITDLRTRSSVRAPGRGPVVAYDFRRPTKISREHVRSLQMAYETFARRLTTLLTSGLRQLCQVTVSDISQQSYDDYIGGLDSPTLITPLAIPPLAGTGTMQFSLPITLAAIDHMLGGPGGKQPVRTLTDIEATLLRGLLDQIVGVLRYAMEPIVAFEPLAGAIEYNPQFLQAAGAADAMIVGEFEMSIGQERSPLRISLPLAALLPRLAQRPREAAAASDRSDQAAVRERLADLPLDVSLQFEPVGLSPSRVLSLAVGDLVPLAHRVGAPLSVHAGGIRYARAVAGKAGTRLAALVVEGPSGTAKEHE